MAADNSDDLDQLLDSALDDFSTLNLRDSNGASASSASPSEPSPSSVRGLGLGLGLPERGAKKKGKKAAAPSKESHASAALEQLRKQTEDAVRGLESAAGVGAVGPGMEGEMDDLLKEFEKLAGGEDMESMVDAMMQQLLSRDILQEPMKELGEKYPKWLEEHKAELKQEDYDRYRLQYELIVKLNEVYEYDPDNFGEILGLMQKMQDCGQPPSDILQGLAPDLDLANLGGQLSPDMLGSTPGCCIM